MNILLVFSDAPITPIDPLLGIKSAVNLPNKEFCISPVEALKMFTKNGAYSVFAEDRIGVLKENYQADFVILDQDPILSTENKILGVYKTGKKIFQATD